MVAPVAVKTVDVPIHILGLFILIVNTEPTVTVAEPVPEQPEVTPVKVYTVVLVGVTTIEDVVALVLHV